MAASSVFGKISVYTAIDPHSSAFSIEGSLLYIQSLLYYT